MPGYSLPGCVGVPACLPGCVGVPACLPGWYIHQEGYIASLIHQEGYIASLIHHLGIPGLLHLGYTGHATHRVYLRVDPLIGYTSGLTPLIGYTYGHIASYKP